MTTPFDAAIKYLTDDLNVLLALNCGEDDPEVVSLRAAIRVLEAAGKVDKEAYLDFFSRMISPPVDIVALVNALPDKEK